MSDAQESHHRAIVQPDRDWLSVAGAISSLVIALATAFFTGWYFVRDLGAADVTEDARIGQIERDIKDAAKEETEYRSRHEDQNKERRGQIEAAQGRTNQRLDGLESSSRTQGELIDRLSYRLAATEAQGQQAQQTLAKITESIADQRTEMARQFAELSGQINGIRQLFERIERQSEPGAGHLPPPPHIVPN